MTETEAVRAMIEGSAPLSLAEIVAEEIAEFVGSPRYKEMAAAEAYYRNHSDVQRKTNRIENRSNVKMEHPILRKLVDQKAKYLLSKPWSVETEDEKYADALGELFDEGFRRKLKSQGKGAVKSGIAWMAPYIGGDGKLDFLRLPSTEVKPLWTDTEHTVLGAYIHFYPQTVYVGRDKRVILRVEYWDKNGVKRFRSKGSIGSFPPVSVGLEPDVELGESENHFRMGEEPYNWTNVPVLWTKYNEEELPLLRFIKDLIDDVNWQKSVTADVLRDVANFIYILRNYGGADLGEFVQELQSALAIKVEGDGGVEKLQADLNIDAVLSFLAEDRRDLYDYASGVDTQSQDLGNASGTALFFRYMDLDSDCAELGAALNDTFRQMKPFLDTWFQLTGRGDFSGSKFSVVFNADMPVNEGDVIQNVVSSQGIVSKKTLLENHPWVKDVGAELKEVEKEKKEDMEAYGGGLFGGDLYGKGGVSHGEEE